MPRFTANLIVADPSFKGSGKAVESLLSHATGHDPGRRPHPRSVRCAHRASHATGHGEISMGAESGDKFAEIFWPRLLVEAPDHSPIPQIYVVALST